MADARPSRRILSIDAYRGATIVAMILVNNPGDWGTVYAPLLHAEWHGWTLTDLVFPFFLFIVGVSIVLALGGRLDAGVARRLLVTKIVKRSAILFALGLFLSGYPFGVFGTRTFARLLETWRIPGVLQRIAVCYLIAALLFVCCRRLVSSRRALAGLCAVLLIGYWLLMVLVPIPAEGADGGWITPDLESKGSHLAGWIDRTLLGSHVWVSSKVYDPEGILSTIPAVCSVLFGMMAGLLLRERKPTDQSPDTGSATAGSPAARTVVGIYVLGTTLTAVGYVWSWFLPINKPLWTSSYAVFTAGLASIVLATSIAVFDLSTDNHGNRARWARPFVRYGQNAIVVFVGSGILARTLSLLRVGDRPLQRVIYDTLFSSVLPPYVASLAYAIAWVLGWYAVLSLMDRKGISIRV